MMSQVFCTMEVHHDSDVVLARQRSREIAALIGYPVQDQIRLATAVSEIARNAVQHAKGGTIDFSWEEGPPASCVVRVTDHGPGMANLASVLAGRHPSLTGAGLGITAARRLVDRFHMESHDGQGTVVELAKAVPAGTSISLEKLRSGASELGRRVADDATAELQRQNHELLQALAELQRRQTELGDANEQLRKYCAELAQVRQELQLQQATIAMLKSELDDTNRGVLALYAELDEQADKLRRASETKSRFLSNMSHEFRTPLYSILGLAGLLLDERDYPLPPEQTKQVILIRKAAEGLTELVNDLLDLAKVEAGKVVVRPHEFDIGALFAGLRSLLKPLLGTNSEVTLTFEEPVGIPVLNTDESKISQILRNFISNALKFTERGEVRVTAALGPDDTVEISVTDTGVGIAPEDIGRVFQEFTQLDSGSQARVKGTGLGLPLSRRLAELLGGRITVSSAPGAGSTFSVILPCCYRGPREVVFTSPHLREAPGCPAAPAASLAGETVLVIDDNEATRLLLRELLRSLGLQCLEAATGSEGVRMARAERPKVIILDLCMPGMDGWEVLKLLKSNAATRTLPIILHSSTEKEDIEGHPLASYAAAILSKTGSSREKMQTALRDVLRSMGLLLEVVDAHA